MLPTTPRVGWHCALSRPIYHFYDTVSGLRSICGAGWRGSDAHLTADEEMRRWVRDNATSRDWRCRNCNRLLNARHAEHHRA